MPASVAVDATVLARVTRIAELEAPAGVAVNVVPVVARYGLGTGGRLGLDAALGAIAPWRLAAEAEVSPRLVPMLLAGDRELGLGIGPRLGTDSSL